MNPKEYGSYFGLEENTNWSESNTSQLSFFKAKTTFSISGRTALYGIVKNGIEKHGWNKLYVPEYYCHDVTNYIRKLNIKILYYHFNPFTGEKSYNITDVDNVALLTVDFFGLNMISIVEFKNVWIIEDLTFNIKKNKKSTAPYSFASLRKELPVISGGFACSSVGSPIQFFQTNLGKEVDCIRLEAMKLKSLYINNSINTKDIFRSLYTQSENMYSLDSLNVEAMSNMGFEVLQKLKINEITKQKEENIKYAKSLLGDIKFLMNCQHEILGAGLLFYFNSYTQRETLRKELLKHNIFPAILWPYQKHKNSSEITSRMLFIHLDYRLTNIDIAYICGKIETISHVI